MVQEPDNSLYLVGELAPCVSSIWNCVIFWAVGKTFPNAAKLLCSVSESTDLHYLGKYFTTVFFFASESA